VLVANAARAQVNIVGVGGWGDSLQEYPDINAVSIEKPFGFTLSVDLARFPSRGLRLGIDHTRSLQLAPFSSGLSFSLVTMKYYLFGPGPESPAETGPARVASFGYKPYLLAGVGIFQGVVAGATGTGFGYGGGGGLDWVLAESFFLRFEGRYLKGTSNSSASFKGASAGVGFSL
jgi:opacity protein-like surface antigen